MNREARRVSLPLSRKDIDSVSIGDELLLTGSLLVGRDQVHREFSEILAAGKELPVSLSGETIYYMGPAPAPEGAVIGSCGPTTSARMDPFAPALLDAGLLAMIGKGPRNEAVREAVIRNKALYLYAYGGCGALYAGKVTEFTCIAFEDFGPEALFRITVRDFPVIVAMDCRGNDIFST